MANQRRPDDAAVASGLRLISTTLEEAGIFVAAQRDGEQIVVTGEVDSPENRQAALDVARAVASRLGLTVVDDLEVMDYTPDAAFGDEAAAPAAGPGPMVESVELPDSRIDPDFAEDEGTTDSEVSAAEAVPFFPPTDPVVRSVEPPDELEVVGGFAPTSMDEQNEEIPRDRVPDDEIAQHVLVELREDATTTDLTIHVRVVDGVVTLRGEAPTLEDAENAEAVASRVEGVAEVREELTIAGLRRDR
jgi:BON domain-containing protein